MRRMVSCAGLLALTVFGTTDPSGILAFAGRPFYVNKSNGKMWVSNGTTFSEVNFTAA